MDHSADLSPRYVSLHFIVHLINFSNRSTDRKEQLQDFDKSD